MACTKHPQGVMMLRVLRSDGKKMPPYFFPQSLNISKEVYLNVLQRVVKPWLDENYPNQAYVRQRDSAPAHKAMVTQKWLGEFLSAYWSRRLLASPKSRL